MSRRGRESRLSSLAKFPISWPAAAMSKGHHLNGVIHDPADQLEGKPMKEITASSVYKQRPAFGSKRDGFDAAVKSARNESAADWFLALYHCCAAWASSPTPR